MFVSFLAYPRELKRLVKKLDGEGVLRDEPLQRLDRQILLWLCVLLLPFYALCLLSDIQLLVGEIIFYHALVMFGAFYIVREIAHRQILPYSCGLREKGVVLTDATYQIAGVYGRLAWCFEYEIMGTDKVKIARVYSKKAMPNPPYKEGMIIPVLLHPSNSKISTPYFALLALQFSIDKRLYNSADTP